MWSVDALCVTLLWTHEWPIALRSFHSRGTFPAGPTTVWSRVTSTTFFGQLHPFTRCYRWRGICRGRAIGYVGSITTLTWSTITLRAALTKWSVTLRPFGTLWSVTAWTAVDKRSIPTGSGWCSATVITAIATGWCTGWRRSLRIEWAIRTITARALLWWTTTVVTSVIGRAYRCPHIIAGRTLFGAVFESGQGGELVRRPKFVAQQAALAAFVFAYDWSDALRVAGFGNGDHFLGRFLYLFGGEFFLDARGCQHHRDGAAQDVDIPDLAWSFGGLYPGTAARHFGLHLDILFVLVGQAAQQTTAHTADFGGVKWQILVFGHFDRHAGIIW